MTDRTIYAALADAVYGNDGKINHEESLKIPNELGWTQMELDGDPNSKNDYWESSSGFGAAAYKNGNEIIISYRGTTFGLSDWLTGNSAILFDKITIQFA